MELMYVFAFFGSFFIGAFILLAIAYVISSLAFVKVFTKLGYQSPVLGWVPILNLYILATLVSTGVKQVKVLGIAEIDVTLYRFAWLLAVAVSFIPGIGKVLSLIIRVIYFGDLYSRVYAATDDTSVEDQVGLGIVSGIFSIVFIVKALAADSNPARIRFRADDNYNNMTI